MDEIDRFFDGDAMCAATCRALEAALAGRYSSMRRDVQKTQVSYRDGGLFCCASRPRRKRDAGRLMVTFGLPFPAPDARIWQVSPVSPGRWTHHVLLSGPDEVDAQLLAWLDESHRMSSRGR